MSQEIINQFELQKQRYTIACVNKVQASEALAKAEKDVAAADRELAESRMGMTMLQFAMDKVKEAQPAPPPPPPPPPPVPAPVHDSAPIPIPNDGQQ